MNKIRKAFFLSLLVVLPAAATPVPTTIIYDWVETGSSYGDGSGTLTMTSTDYGSDLYPGSYYDYAVTDLTGTINGLTITGLHTPITSSADHLVFSVSSSPTAATFYGATLHFVANGNNYALSGYTKGASYTISEPTGDAGEDLFSITLAPVPEPSSLALLTAAGLFIGWRTYRTRRAARA